MAPRRWRRSRLSTLPERAEPAFIRFDVETDEGGHFTSDVTLEVTWDREQNQLAVRHPLHSPGGIWRSLADHVYVLSDPSGVFQELRFTDVMIDFPDEPAV